MKSYIKVLVNKNKKEIINYILNLNINIYSTKKVKEGLIIKIDYNDFYKIKSKYKGINIIEKTGKINIIEKLSKYKHELISFIIFIFFIILLSLNTLYINIDTDTSGVKKRILKELYSENIKPFTFKKSFNKLNSIKKSIIDNNKSKIEWLELKYDGVYLNVKVIERKNKKEKNVKNNYTDLIATKNGYVRKLNITSGDILKSIGDYVNKGDVIVTGNIIKNDEIINRQRSIGTVYGEVWYIKKVNRNVYSNKYKKTKYSYIKFVFENKGKSIDLFKLRVKSSAKYKKNIFKNRFFSLNIKKSNIYKKTRVKEPLSVLVSSIKNDSYKNVLNTLNKDEYIIDEKVLKKSVYNDKISMDILFKVYEKISKEKEINTKDINNINNTNKNIKEE